MDKTVISSVLISFGEFTSADRPLRANQGQQGEFHHHTGQHRPATTCLDFEQREGNHFVNCDKRRQNLARRRVHANNKICTFHVFSFTSIKLAVAFLFGLLSPFLFALTVENVSTNVFCCFSRSVQTLKNIALMPLGAEAAPVMTTSSYPNMDFPSTYQVATHTANYQIWDNNAVLGPTAANCTTLLMKILPNGTDTTLQITFGDMTIVNTIFWIESPADGSTARLNIYLQNVKLVDSFFKFHRLAPSPTNPTNTQYTITLQGCTVHQRSAYLDPLIHRRLPFSSCQPAIAFFYFQSDPLVNDGHNNADSQTSVIAGYYISITNTQITLFEKDYAAAVERGLGNNSNNNAAANSSEMIAKKDNPSTYLTVHRAGAVLMGEGASPATIVVKRLFPSSLGVTTMALAYHCSPTVARGQLIVTGGSVRVVSSVMMKDMGFIGFAQEDSTVPIAGEEGDENGSESEGGGVYSSGHLRISDASESIWPPKPIDYASPSALSVFNGLTQSSNPLLKNAAAMATGGIITISQAQISLRNGCDSAYSKADIADDANIANLCRGRGFSGFNFVLSEEELNANITAADVLATSVVNNCTSFPHHPYETLRHTSLVFQSMPIQSPNATNGTLSASSLSATEKCHRRHGDAYYASTAKLRIVESARIEFISNTVSAVPQINGVFSPAFGELNISGSDSNFKFRQNQVSSGMTVPLVSVAQPSVPALFPKLSGYDAGYAVIEQSNFSNAFPSDSLFLKFGYVDVTAKTISEGRVPSIRICSNYKNGVLYPADANGVLGPLAFITKCSGESMTRPTPAPATTTALPTIPSTSPSTTPTAAATTLAPLLTTSATQEENEETGDTTIISTTPIDSPRTTMTPTPNRRKFKVTASFAMDVDAFQSFSMRLVPLNKLRQIRDEYRLRRQELEEDMKTSKPTTEADESRLENSSSTTTPTTDLNFSSSVSLLNLSQSLALINAEESAAVEAAKIPMTAFGIIRDEICYYARAKAEDVALVSIAAGSTVAEITVDNVEENDMKIWGKAVKKTASADVPAGATTRTNSVLYLIASSLKITRITEDEAVLGFLIVLMFVAIAIAVVLVVAAFTWFVCVRSGQMAKAAAIAQRRKEQQQQASQLEDDSDNNKNKNSNGKFFNNNDNDGDGFIINADDNAFQFRDGQLLLQGVSVRDLRRDLCSKLNMEASSFRNPTAATTTVAVPIEDSCAATTTATAGATTAAPSSSLCDESKENVGGEGNGKEEKGNAQDNDVALQTAKTREHQKDAAFPTPQLPPRPSPFRIIHPFSPLHIRAAAERSSLTSSSPLSSLSQQKTGLPREGEEPKSEEDERNVVLSENNGRDGGLQEVEGRRLLCEVAALAQNNQVSHLRGPLSNDNNNTQQHHKTNNNTNHHRNERNDSSSSGDDRQHAAAARTATTSSSSVVVPDAMTLVRNLRFETFQRSHLGFGGAGGNRNDGGGGGGGGWEEKATIVTGSGGMGMGMDVGVAGGANDSNEEEQQQQQEALEDLALFTDLSAAPSYAHYLHNVPLPLRSRVQAANETWGDDDEAFNAVAFHSKKDGRKAATTTQNEQPPQHDDNDDDDDGESRPIHHCPSSTLPSATDNTITAAASSNGEEEEATVPLRTSASSHSTTRAAKKGRKRVTINLERNEHVEAVLRASREE